MIAARLAAVLLLLAAPLSSGAALAQGAKTSSIVEADISKLKPGQFIWAPELAPRGPMVLVVDLKTQQASVYRNGVRIGASTVSSGKKGHKTPTGVFTILQKNKDHRSNLYNNAPMPYMQRLTWDGIALHAGNLPGYPASHGCVRLPMAFAKELFAETDKGMTVVVTDTSVSPTELDAGDLLAPVTATGAGVGPVAKQRLAKGEAWRWQPELAPSGPVTIVISAKDQRLMVMRNGKMIGRGQAHIPAGRLVGTHALEFKGFGPDGAGKWLYIGIPGQERQAGKALDLSGAREMAVAPEYLAKVRSVLTPGATLLATDGGILSGSAGKAMTVIDATPG